MGSMSAAPTFFEMSDRRRAEDRQQNWWALQQPGEHELRRPAALLVGDALQRSVAESAS
jgi:hypothetical protein